VERRSPTPVSSPDIVERKSAVARYKGATNHSHAPASTTTVRRANLEARRRNSGHEAHWRPRKLLRRRAVPYLVCRYFLQMGAVTARRCTRIWKNHLPIQGGGRPSRALEWRLLSLRRPPGAPSSGESLRLDRLTDKNVPSRERKSHRPTPVNRDQ